jgi:hypothetical protein
MISRISDVHTLMGCAIELLESRHGSKRLALARMGSLERDFVAQLCGSHDGDCHPAWLP